ncbi:putative signal-transduction protein [gamma proteobacterium IMCC2047]|nr:putative signal-transduction protein [gamma proteobacterium IMCC2047]
MVADFLKRCPPFNVLPETEFQWLIGRLEITYFRQGHVFSDDEDQGGLRILRSGAVEIRDASGKLLDRLGEGENFNIAGLCKSRPDTRAVLIEDSLIYFLKQPDYQTLREKSREFDRFFHSQRDRRLRRAVRYEASPHQLMTPLATLMSKDVLMIPCDESVQKSAQMMTERRVSSALVMDQGRLCGIITDRDFRSRVLAQGVTGTDR